MKKYLKHLAFLFAVFLLAFALYTHLDNSWGSEPIEIINITFSIVVIFFLWKNNYFTRNKS
tara:strand:+ start:255 stop:437 length:183 start_codon:yes stop_codon:yes gene_type:complete